MKIRTTQSVALILKPKPLWQSLSVSVMLMIAAVLMFLSYRDHQTAYRVKYALREAAAPIVEVFSEPTRAVTDFAGRVQHALSLYQQNDYLRQQNATLLKWQTIAWQMRRENQELRELLGIDSAAGARHITARIISRAHDPLRHSLMVRFAANQDIREGLPVVVPEGLVGFVIDSHDRMAHVLLITDRQSRVPVEHESTGARAILAGNNQSEQLTLHHVNQKGTFTDGDRLVTNNAHLFPVNIAIGEVQRDQEGKIRVNPYANTNNLEFVTIVVPGQTPKL